MSSSRMRRVVVFLALISLASVVLSGITPLLSLRLKPLEVVYQRVGVYSKKDSPFGTNALSSTWVEPYALWNLQWSTPEAVSSVNFTGRLGEIVIMHHKWRPSFGIGGPLLEELYADGKCRTPRQLVFPETLRLDAEGNSQDGLLIYDGHLPADFGPDNIHSHRESYNVSVSGVYYLFFANCQEDTDLFIDGQIKWVNPYGYLPAQILGYLPAYIILFLLYTFVIIWFALISFQHRKDLLGLQILVLVFLLVAWMENLIWFCDYVVYNNNGVVNDTVNVFGALFTSLKSTLIRDTLLLCALGFSITKPLLRKRVSIPVILLSLAYFAIEAVTQYLLVAKTAGAYISDGVQLFFEIVLIILNIMFGIWIVLALFMQMRSLRSNAQAEKYNLYVRLTILLIVCAIIAIIFYISEVAATFADWEDESFRVWWLWDTYWEFFYFAVAVAIAVIWRPTEHNSQYAFSEQLPSEEAPSSTDANEVMLEESEKPKPTKEKGEAKSHETKDKLDKESSSFDSKSSS